MDFLNDFACGVPFHTVNSALWHSWHFLGPRLNGSAVEVAWLIKRTNIASKPTGRNLKIRIAHISNCFEAVISGFSPQQAELFLFNNSILTNSSAQVESLNTRNSLQILRLFGKTKFVLVLHYDFNTRHYDFNTRHCLFQRGLNKIFLIKK